jgi:hypothetical protein
MLMRAVATDVVSGHDKNARLGSELVGGALSGIINNGFFDIYQLYLVLSGRLLSPNYVDI